MAISRDKKQTLVAELTELLKDAKGTAFARYQTLTVADLQELRKAAREAGVTIKVVKNRLSSSGNRYLQRNRHQLIGWSIGLRCKHRR